MRPSKHNFVFVVLWCHSMIQLIKHRVAIAFSFTNPLWLSHGYRHSVPGSPEFLQIFVYRSSFV